MPIQVDYRSFTGNNHLQVTNKLTLMIKLLMTIEATAEMNLSLVWFRWEKALARQLLPATSMVMAWTI